MKFQSIGHVSVDTQSQQSFTLQSFITKDKCKRWIQQSKTLKNLSYCTLSLQRAWKNWKAFISRCNLKTIFKWNIDFLYTHKHLLMNTCQKVTDNSKKPQMF